MPLTLLAVMLLRVLLVTQQGNPPPLPFVDEGACPFECCTYRDWTATAPVAVYDRWTWESPPSSGVSKVLFKIGTNEKVTAMTGVVITTRPGRVRVTQPVTVQNFPVQFPQRPSEDISLQAGDLIYLLTNRGEGSYTAWFKGRLLEAVDTVPLRIGANRPGGAVLEQTAVSRWWVRVRNAKGQIGWTNRPQDFANKDACGG